MKFVSKEGKKFDIVAAILNSTQQSGCISVASFRPRYFVHMASDMPFNCHSGLRLLLSHIILSQTCSRLGNDSIEDSEVDNRLEKIHFDASKGKRKGKSKLYLARVAHSATRLISRRALD